MNEQSKTKTLSRLNDVLRRLQDIKEPSTSWPDIEEWRQDATVAIRYAFGESSDYVTRFKSLKLTAGNGPYQRGLRAAEAMLKPMIKEVEEYWEEAPAKAVGEVASGSEVFVIHGHDEAAQAAVARFLEQLGLEPVILAEQPSGGKTIIEKFETHADVGYAVALLTADDFGSRQGDDAVRPRARQNVIFELGYFIGRLGRERVCALTKGQPEIPSDYSGVVYISMDGKDDWQGKLVQELREAGINAL